ncbi:MAG: ABC transporter substrate-binding protein [Clostridiaceae bacterium]|nr:ABC transporter substrate-binding protein [Eubacteriales bacterium]
MKKILAVTLVFLMTLALVACAPTQEAKAPEGTAPVETQAAGTTESAAPVEEVPGEPILIGVYGPLSGNSAMVGATLVEGVKLAAKQINVAGGIGGRPIELVVEDDAQDPATAVSAVNKLIYSDNVVGVIGTVNSSCTLASMEVSRDAGIPHITPISSGAAITNLGNPWIARVQASDLLQAGAIVKYAVEELGAKRIACLYQSDDYGTGAMEVIVEELAKYGIELVANEAFDANAADVTPQLLNVQKANCDALIMWTMYQQGALIAKQARQLGIEAQLLGGGGLTNAKLYELGGDAVVGVINSQTFFADKSQATPAAAAFIDAFQAEYGKMPDSNNAMAYDSMMIMAEGLKHAGADLDPAKIMEGILAVENMELATGTITMADNGDAVRDKILMVRLIGDKQYELVTGAK